MTRSINIVEESSADLHHDAKYDDATATTTEATTAIGTEATTTRAPLVQSINSIEEYMDFTSDGQLTVVKFYASWCRSCARFDVKYRKLARRYQDQDVRFAECEFVSHRDMCTSIGVTRFPHLHIHKGKAGKVADFLCGPKTFQRLVDKVEEYVDATAEEILFKQKLREGDSLLEEEDRIELAEKHIINVFV